MMKKWTALLLTLAMLLCLTGALAESGAEGGNTCSHYNTWAQETYSVEHESTGGVLYHDSHMTYYSVTICEDCGEETGREEIAAYTDREAHWWTNAGVCGYCGQENSCVHDGYCYPHEREKNPVISSDGNTRYHQVTYELYQESYCIACDVLVTSELVGSNVYSIEHSWDANNVCTECGFESACQHINTYQQESYSSEYAQIDDPRYHERSYTFYYHTNCDDCGASDVAPVEVFDQYTEQEEHVWNPDGVCRTCAQVNDCAHEELDPGYVYQTNWHYVAIEGNDLEHAEAYDLCGYKCMTCGYWLDEPVYVETVLSGWMTSHNWGDDGLCRDCGYVNPCEHNSGTNTYYESMNWRYEDAGDTKYHNYLYDHYLVTACNACNMRLEKVYQTTESYQWEHNWNEENVCWDCGHVNTCEHGVGEESRETWKNHRCQSVNDPKQHESAADVYTTYFCTGCGAQLREEYARTETNLESHWWGENGEQIICNGCLQVNTCAHTGEVEIGEWWTNGRFEDIGDPDYHNYLTDAYHSKTCMDCGYYLGDEYVGVETRQDPHYYTDGVCGGCGATCAHTETYTSLTQEGHTWVNVGVNEYHEYHYQEYNDTYCSACGMRTQRELIQEHIDQYGHAWNDEGVCNACGYVNTCEHENTYTSIGTPTSFYEMSQVNGNHYYTANVVEYTYCSDCYMTVAEKDNGVQRTQQAHSYDADGLCACGYEQGGCEHLNAEQIGGNQRYKTFEKIDNEKHSYSFDVYWTYSCADCGSSYEVYIERGTEEDDHHFGEDGICQQCGAQKPACESHFWVNGECKLCGAVCPHDGGSYITTVQRDRQHVNVGSNSYHEYRYNVYTAECCMTCGGVIELLGLESEGNVEQVGHAWDENGYCEPCGKQNDCEHPDTTETYKRGNEYYESAPEAGHHYFAVEYVHYEYCEDCRLTLWEKISNVERELQAHSYNEAGMCVCGTERVICENHFWVNGECKVCGETCPHGGETYIRVIQDDREHVNVGSFSYHEYRYNQYNATCCVVCNGVIERGELVSSGHVEQVGHAWDNNGVCQPCGMRNSCAHLSTTETYKRGNEFYECAQEAGYHYYTVEYINYEYCETCRLTLWEKISSVEREQQAHSYNESGVCVCGAVEGECQHENATQTGGSQKYKTFVNLGDEGHSYSFDVYWTYACSDCGVTYEVYIERGTETDTHHFNEIGACECGAWCNHNNKTELSSELTATTVSAIDGEGSEAFHKQYYSEDITYQCHDCNQEVTYTYTRVCDEGHSYDADGLCACGAQGAPTTCEHANTQMQEFRVELGYTYDDDFHHLKYNEYEGEWCTDCQSYRSRTLTAEGTITSGHTLVNCACVCGYTVEPCETHSWSNGVCYVCGLIACENHNWVEGVCTVCQTACAHTGETVELGRRTTHVSYERFDEAPEMHNHVQQVYVQFGCADCGMDLGEQDMGTETVTEAHSFADGACVCGYTCSHGYTYETLTEEGNTCVDVDDPEYHEYRYVEYRNTFCTTCDMLMSRKGYECAERQPHTWNDDGVCACGAKQPCETHSWVDGVCSVCGAACGHEDSTATGKGTWENAVYTYVDDEIHHAVYDYAEFYLCNTCGLEHLVTVETGREDDEPHEWTFNPNATDCRFCGATKPACETHSWVDGVCSVCGEECAHANESFTGKGTQEQLGCTDNGDGTHTRTFKVLHIYNCADCGHTYNKYIEDGSETEAHVFGGDGVCVTAGCGATKPACETHDWVDGVCSVCGEECVHEGGTESKTINGDEVRTNIGNTRYHKYTFNVYNSLCCTECDAEVERGELIVNGVVEWEEHTWDSNDVCALCGVAKSDLVFHTWVDGVCSECGTACAHEYDEERKTEFENYRYTNTGDAAVHTVEYDVYVYPYCIECDMDLPKVFVRTYSSTADHSLNEDGVCTQCGWAGSACEHANQNSYSTTENYRYESLGNLQHNYTYDVYDVVQCMDCWTTLSREYRESYSYSDWHYWLDQEDGTKQCSDCGHVNTCEHTGEREVFIASTNFGYEQIDNSRYHKVTYEDYHDIRCADCRVQIAYEFAETKEYEAAHTWDDSGTCIQCRQVNACTHDVGTYTSEATFNYRYESFNDPLYHNYVWDVRVDHYCEGCGLFMYSEDVKQDSVQYEHWWNDQADGGYVCGGCEQENACEHVNTETYNSEWYGEYEKYDAAHHTYTYELHVVKNCLDCGLQLSNENLGQYSELREHWWNDQADGSYVCGGCGEENACAHATRGTAESRDNWAYEGSSDDMKHHTATYDVYTIEYCQDCGLQLSRTFVEQKSEKYEHWWGEQEDGRVVCGACELENTCEHAQQEIRRTTEDWTYEQIDDPREHLATYKVYHETFCPDCYMTTGEREYIGVESSRYLHSWNAEGVCYDCGQTSSCLHENVEVEYWQYNGTYTSIDDPKYHQVTFDKHRVEVCQDCGYRVSDVSLGLVTEQQWHWWNEVNGKLICGGCMQENTCTHENVDSWTWNSFKSCESTGDLKYHSCVYDVYSMSECLDCGRYTEEITGETTGLETHNWNDEGVCTACEQANACPHARTTSRIDNDNYETSQCGDASFHETTYDIILITECADCNGEAGREVLEQRTRKESHFWYELEDGSIACDTCGQINACAHTETNQRVAEEILTYTTDGADAHIVAKRADIENYCVSCGATVSVTEGDEVEVREGHNWDGETCGNCGEANTCTHENAVTRESYSYSNYENLGEEGHSVTVKTYTRQHCYVCGYRSDRKLVSTEQITEAHEKWVECECGYINPCEHENTYTETWYTGSKCEHVDDENHAYWGYLVTAQYCKDCGELVSETVNTTLEQYRVEKHWFNDVGLCEDCAFAEPVACQHANTTSVTDFATSENAVYCNDKVHAVDHIKYTHTVCQDCGEDLGNIQNVETVTTYEAHNYNSYGACYECGAKNSCTHEGKTSQSFYPDEWDSIVMVDEKNHMVTGTIVTNTWCEDCGQYLGETISEFGEHLIEHELYEGVCDYCGYIAGCTHENTHTIEEADEDWPLYYIPVDADKHMAVCEKWRYTVCSDCGEYLWSMGSQKIGEVQIEQAHTKENDFCVQCGYSCAHSNSIDQGYEMIEGAPIQQDPPHPTYHLQPYSVVFTYLCNDCGQTYTRSEEMSGQEAHDYLTYDETTGLWVCACGATSEEQTTCAHENKEYRTCGMDEYRMLDSDTHEHTFNTYGGMWCLDCGTYRTWQLDILGEALIEAHVYDDDADTDCNHCIYIREVTDSRKILVLPAGLTAIEEEAFMGVSMFTHVQIPESVTSIGTDAFERGTIIIAPTGSFAHRWANQHGYTFEELSE